MAILKLDSTVTREVLANAGFKGKGFDKNLSNVLDNENVYERLWIISDDKGRVIIYADSGNSWCTIVYCSDEVIISDGSEE